MDVREKGVIGYMRLDAASIRHVCCFSDLLLGMSLSSAERILISQLQLSIRPAGGSLSPNEISALSAAFIKYPLLVRHVAAFQATLN